MTALDHDVLFWEGKEMNVMLLLTGIFVLVGILFMNGKAAFLIAGYNSMSEEQKEEYDEVAICKFMGKSMFVLALGMALGVLGEKLNMNWLLNLSIALAIATAIFVFIYTFRWKRFKK